MKPTSILTVDKTMKPKCLVCGEKRADSVATKCHVCGVEYDYSTQMHAKGYTKRMRDFPPEGCEFKVGDVVSYKNDYGVVFEPRVIIGFAFPGDEVCGGFIYLNVDCWWFPMEPKSLTPYKK